MQIDDRVSVYPGKQCCAAVGYIEAINGNKVTVKTDHEPVRLLIVPVECVEVLL